MRRYSFAGLLLAGGLFAACGSTSTSTDSGTPTDSSVADSTSADVPVTDAPHTDAPQGDGSTGATCAGQPEINLNTAGTRTGTTTDYMGDTTAAWMAQTMGHPSGHQPIAPPSANTTCPTDSGQVVMKYTTGSAPSVLTISTSNPGTPTSFDTVLYMTLACRTVLTAAECNDDDPRYAASAMRKVTSFLTTQVFAANTTVYIVVGGYYPGPGDGSTIDHGAFELTVQENPPVAMGGACQTDGTAEVCGTGLGCVGTTPIAPTGTCQPFGTAAGSQCRTSTPACDGALMCDQTLAVPTCVNSVANGMPCDGYNECGNTSTCVSSAFGGPTGTCVANGSLGSGCLPMGTTGGRCSTGLTCSSDIDSTVTSPTCVNVTTMSGGPCDVLRTYCATGMTCVTLDGSSFIGTCRTDGTAARTHCRQVSTTVPTACDMPLSCQTQTDANMTMLCMNVAADGQACTPDTQCAMTATCLLSDNTDRERGLCTTNGSLGGVCNSTGTACAGSATCSDMTTPANGLCQNVQTTVGGACNTLTASCGNGLSCVLTVNASGVPDPRNGTCQTNGAAAGAACAAGATACTGSLVCDGSVLSNGTCERAVTASTGVCDSLHGSTACASGSVCRPTAYNVGACAGPTVAEMEPVNNSPGSLHTASFPAITTATSYAGSLPFADIDCVPVQVVANGGILAQVDDGAGRCPVSFGGEILLDVYGTDGVTVRGEALDTGPNGQCATIDGNRMVTQGTATVPAYPYANHLAAGTYYVCARGVINNTTGEVSTATSYIMHVAPLPATP